jgi:hypothetical protein
MSSAVTSLALASSLLSLSLSLLVSETAVAVALLVEEGSDKCAQGLVGSGETEAPSGADVDAGVATVVAAAAPTSVIIAPLSFPSSLELDLGLQLGISIIICVFGTQSQAKPDFGGGPDQFVLNDGEGLFEVVGVEQLFRQNIALAGFRRLVGGKNRVR